MLYEVLVIISLYTVELESGRQLVRIGTYIYLHGEEDYGINLVFNDSSTCFTLLYYILQNMHCVETEFIPRRSL